MHCTALATFGKKTSKTHDWFDAKSTEMRPVIEAKRTALIEYKQAPSERNLQILRAASPGARFNKLRGDLQMERWVEHYSDFYSRENTVSPAALDAIECLPTMDELDSEPLVEELSKAIDSLASGKAPGRDSPWLDQTLKLGKTTSLHEVLCQCWQEGAVSQDMRDSKIITLYKNKGERHDFNNYRGISVLSIVGKVFARIILIRFQKLAERSHNVASELNGQQ